jgi:hypothetical protein
MNIPFLQQATLAVGGLVVLNTVMQAVWNNHSVRKIALYASLGGVLVGTVATIASIFALAIPFTYDSPHTWDEPDGLAYTFSQCAKNGVLLAIVSTIAFAII